MIFRRMIVLGALLIRRSPLPYGLGIVCATLALSTLVFAEEVSQATGEKSKRNSSTATTSTSRTKEVGRDTAANGAHGESQRILIVSSLPRTGSARQQTDSIVNGIRMALDEVNSRVGDFRKG